MAAQSSFQDLVQSHASNIIKGSVKTAPPIITDIQNHGGDAAQAFLLAWQSKKLWYRRADKRLIFVEKINNESFVLLDLQTNAPIDHSTKAQIKQIKPNSGLRGLLGTALVSSQLISDNLDVRVASLKSLARDPKRTHLVPLRLAMSKETDTDMLAQMTRLERLLTMQYDTDVEARVSAITSFENDLGLDVRARLNPMLDTSLILSQSSPREGTFARMLVPGATVGLSVGQAYDMIVAKGWAPADISTAEKRTALIDNIQDGFVAGVGIETLNTDADREAAYTALAATGAVPSDVSQDDIQDVLTRVYFYETYDEPSNEVVAAAAETLGKINTKVSLSQTIDLFLDGLSLASIFFLAAIGLAITFGVMGVINMAHGEFIMMGAYTGYVVQQIIDNYTLSILIAIPAAFAVTFAAGVAMERLVVRHLYHRPLETLLATFGVSIALQQIAKNVFGTQARPLTSPDWLGGAWMINDVISISWIRVAIFVLSILFFVMLWFTLNKTRFGMETRAVTQNPRMAASMGINPDKINMLTFGLGSGIAGIAGVAIGLFAKVTSELGSDYIVQSFMTVVVGGVGNIWGTLAGAAMIGFLQKGIEWFNPSNTLAAQTFMIVFIIIFIQFRPRGIIALRGRAAGD
ncbi:branched-chain amino acid ABC transporter, permease protein [Rhodobacterales bacterium HTCC2150]|nr:branched-chain amino acid ABC transporter, permease protein [Rhodobacterales bacterium HTCC2150] [Rhodobacteraceae bacterium HTCC2150]